MHKFQISLSFVHSGRGVIFVISVQCLYLALLCLFGCVFAMSIAKKILIRSFGKKHVSSIHLIMSLGLVNDYGRTAKF